LGIFFLCTFRPNSGLLISGDIAIAIPVVESTFLFTSLEVTTEKIKYFFSHDKNVLAYSIEASLKSKEKFYVEPM
jgi:hypothetical protein